MGVCTKSTHTRRKESINVCVSTKGKGRGQGGGGRVESIKNIFVHDM